MVPYRLNLLHFPKSLSEKAQSHACSSERPKKASFRTWFPQGCGGEFGEDGGGGFGKSASLLPEWGCPWLSRPPLQNKPQTDALARWRPFTFHRSHWTHQTESVQRFEHVCLHADDVLLTSVSILWKPFLAVHRIRVYIYNTPIPCHRVTVC